MKDDRVVIYEGEDYKIITDASEKPKAQDVIHTISFIEHERSKKHIRHVFSKVLIKLFVCMGIYLFLIGKGIIKDNLISIFIASIITLIVLWKN